MDSICEQKSFFSKFFVFKWPKLIIFIKCFFEWSVWVFFFTFLILTDLTNSGKFSKTNRCLGEPNKLKSDFVSKHTRQDIRRPQITTNWTKETIFQRILSSWTHPLFLRWLEFFCDVFLWIFVGSEALLFIQTVSCEFKCAVIFDSTSDFIIPAVRATSIFSSLASRPRFQHHYPSSRPILRRWCRHLLVTTKEFEHDSQFFFLFRT